MSIDSQARIVIVGGGIMGVALAYHLAEEGETNVMLIEKGDCLLYTSPSPRD